jgi:hypothetical protein
MSLRGGGALDFLRHPLRRPKLVGVPCILIPGLPAGAIEEQTLNPTWACSFNKTADGIGGRPSIPSAIFERI